MNFLVDENTYLRSQVEKNMSNFSVELMRSEKSGGRSRMEQNSRNSYGERKSSFVNGQKNMFRMKLMDLQRERKFHSVDIPSHSISQPLLPAPHPIRQRQYETNINLNGQQTNNASEFDSKSTSYFINENRKQSNAPAKFLK